ncbi:MAG: Ig domain-containing protein [Isosphaeraceae bacterium]
MRRNRRGANSGHEFGGSGEDSFVAVVVTKLTGALLFILLLTMVIMALIPKAVDIAPEKGKGADQGPTGVPLAITTPEKLPEAIAGRPYTIALAAVGGRGSLRWSLDGTLPEGLNFDPGTGVLEGTPSRGTPQPITLALRVSDGDAIATREARLLVYQSDRPLTTPAWWKPGIPPLPWRAWVDQGVGFLVLWLVHLVSMGAIGSLERATQGGLVSVRGREVALVLVRRRFGAYRLVVRSATLLAMMGLAAWLWAAR